MIHAIPSLSAHNHGCQVELVALAHMTSPRSFLDKLPEFDARSLEVLRQPMEDKLVTISHASGSLTFPANFQLIAAMNPCKCGWYGDPVKPCTCSPEQIKQGTQSVFTPPFSPRT